MLPASTVFVWIYQPEVYLYKKDPPAMSGAKQAVGQLIKKARTKAGLTQQELGEKLGVGRAVVNGYESGKQNLTIDTLEKIAKALGVDLRVDL